MVSESVQSWAVVASFDFCPYQCSQFDNPRVRSTVRDRLEFGALALLFEVHQPEKGCILSVLANMWDSRSPLLLQLKKRYRLPPNSPPQRACAGGHLSLLPTTLPSSHFRTSCCLLFRPCAILSYDAVCMQHCTSTPQLVSSAGITNHRPRTSSPWDITGRTTLLLSTAQ